MPGNQGNIWYFGHRVGLDFNNLDANGNPTLLTDGIVETYEGVATISDKDGSLLFYTDGIDVFSKEPGGATHEFLLYDSDDSKSRVYIDDDKQDNEYQGNYWDYHPTKIAASGVSDFTNNTKFKDFSRSTGLFGDWSSTQSAVIVPIPLTNTNIADGWREPYKYVIFTVPAKGGSFFQDRPNGSRAGNAGSYCCHTKDLTTSAIDGNPTNPTEPYKHKGVSYDSTNDIKTRDPSYCRGKRTEQHGSLHYSIMDLRYNTVEDYKNLNSTYLSQGPDTNGKPQGVGIIVKRNRPVGYDDGINSGIQYKKVSEKIAAINGDNDDIWIVVRLESSLGFLVTKVSSSGVQPNVDNKVYSDGSDVTLTVLNTSPTGYMRFSPDGAKLAMNRGDGWFRLYNFDKIGGIIDVVNTKSIYFGAGTADTNIDKFSYLEPYGLEIAIDTTLSNNDYIYYASGREARRKGYFGGSNNLTRDFSVFAFQDAIFSGATKHWDTSSTTFQNSGIKADCFKTIISTGHTAGMQFGTNGRIYVAQHKDTTNLVGGIYENNPELNGGKFWGKHLDAIVNTNDWANITHAPSAVTISDVGVQKDLTVFGGLPTFISSFFNACASFSITISGSTDALTVGGSEGEISGQSIGATSTVNWQWFDDNDNDIGQLTRIGSGLSAGTYKLSASTLIDGVYCYDTTTASIGEPDLFGSSSYMYCEDICEMTFGSSSGGGIYYEILDTSNQEIECIKVLSGIVSDPIPSKELTAGCCEIDSCDNMIEFKFSCIDEPPPVPLIPCYDECSKNDMYGYTYTEMLLAGPATPGTTKYQAWGVIKDIKDENNQAPDTDDIITLKYVTHFEPINITKLIRTNWYKIFELQGNAFDTNDNLTWRVAPHCEICPPQCGYYMIGGTIPHQSLATFNGATWEATKQPECVKTSHSFPTNLQAYCEVTSDYYYTTCLDVNGVEHTVDGNGNNGCLPKTNLSAFLSQGIFEHNIDYAAYHKLDFTEFNPQECEKILEKGIVLFKDNDGCLCIATVDNYKLVVNMIP